ncbi:MAG: hypothetical protein GY953_01555, partial [bacterium]|nr:hypothetical protein [bacterium]
MLKWALLANATFSVLSATLIVWAGRPLSAWMGLPDLRPTAVSLVVFAAGVVYVATRNLIPTKWAWGIVILDALWVAGTVAGMELGVFSSGGRWLAGI